MNRNSTPPRDIPMNLSAALPAAKPGKLNATASVGTGLAAKCIPQCVSNVPRNVKCLSSLERAGRYIVVTATTRSNRAASRSLVHLDSMGLEPNLALEGLEPNEFAAFR